MERLTLYSWNYKKGLVTSQRSLAQILDCGYSTLLDRKQGQNSKFIAGQKADVEYSGLILGALHICDS